MSSIRLWCRRRHGKGPTSDYQTMVDGQQVKEKGPLGLGVRNEKDPRLHTDLRFPF